MSAETMLYAWLSGHAPLVALVGTSIHPDVVPQNAPRPAVSYSRVDTEYITTIHDSVVHGSFVSMQIQCWAKDDEGTGRSVADQIADEVEAALAANGEVPTARGVLFDEATGDLGTSVDARLLA
jgi:hypothetical protein